MRFLNTNVALRMKTGMLRMKNRYVAGVSAFQSYIRRDEVTYTKVHKNEVWQINMPINNGMKWELSEENLLIKAFDAEIPIKKLLENINGQKALLGHVWSFLGSLRNNSLKWAFIM